jgi:uncharacterized repeat protein (TIGR01451 family)
MRNLRTLKRAFIAAYRAIGWAICCVTANVLPQYALARDSVPAETTPVEPSPVETSLVAEVLEKVAGVDGKPLQRLVPAGVISQGDVIYYTVKIRNPTTVPARDVAVVQRIPANTTYVPRSASGPSADITFSADGGSTFKPAGELTVVSAAGVPRPATPQDYTHIRWQLRNVLAPGAVALARFQAVFQ